MVEQRTNRTEAIQIAFTYMGTIVGAGFATGQEILQFFTKYGAVASMTILIATMLFIALGQKLMLLAKKISATSYEDLNKMLLGERAGKYISFFMLIVLLGVSSVMLAGSGTILYEHWNIPYQVGLLFTALICFFVLRKGMNAILTVNSIVVPLMLIFTAIVIVNTLQQPTSGQIFELRNQAPVWSALLSPFLYTAFNLALAQAVLVPLGAKASNNNTIKLGAILGGVGIGFMLLAGHFALSAHMPDIARLAIPMGGIANQLGTIIQFGYIIIIFSEIFTTLIADVYGLTLQLQKRVPWSHTLLLAVILFVCFFISQIGFEPLLSTLYPLFGFISLIWLIQLLRK
ncbi:hypothetical protein ACFSTH_08710 [Paenibacillus yanchengensis]|uniref:Membrane protein YkvI n=1 Tax=Paenibacillus yanchengensis TaxID=2035833 RepID=A0ABW4YKR7_9BACL